MNMQSYKFVLAVSFFSLGLALPIICIILSAIWEVDGFVYLAFAMPFLFSGFGFALGFVLDRLNRQNALLGKINSNLKEQSIIDDLTGQYNRRHIILALEKEIERARRYRRPLAGIMIDIDDFKKFNDRFGHLLGDYILKEVTTVFDHCIRTIDVLGRYGGDEFIILLPEATPETAKVVAERIKKAIREHDFTFKKKKFKVTCSIGVHFFDDLTNTDKLDFIEKIDTALYAAKTAGKNRVVTK